MRSPDEQTDTREKILLAAIDCFGAEGFSASLRTIAAKAGVSAALIIKHFESKEGLRSACDDYVMGEIATAKSDAMRSKNLGGTFLSQMANFDDLQPLMHYWVRTFFDGGQVSLTLLTRLREQAKQWMSDGVAAGHIKPSRNEDLRIMFAFSASIGWLFQAILLSGKSLDELDGAFWMKTEEEMIQASLEVYTEGLLTTSTMLDEYMRYRGTAPSATGTSASATSATGTSASPTSDTSTLPGAAPPTAE